VAAAIIYAWFTIQEWRVFDSERRTMEQEMVEMREGRILDERAWVTAFHIASYPSERGSNWIYFGVDFKNTGRTPAANATIWFGEFSIDQLPKEFPPTNAHEETSLIAPGATLSMDTRYLPLFKEGEAIENGHKLFLMGVVKYDDIFGKHHWSKSCWNVGSDLKRFESITISNSCDDIRHN
jgi:hypothetical protein